MCTIHILQIELLPNTAGKSTWAETAVPCQIIDILFRTTDAKGQKMPLKNAQPVLDYAPDSRLGEDPGR